MGINWHERLIVFGQTGAGKSEILNYQFSILRCQKVLLDTKPEFTIPGVQPVHSVDEIDWDQPIIHYRDLDNDLEEYDRLAWMILRRRHCVLCCHEAADLCEDQPNKTGTNVRKLLRKGNIRGDGALLGSQRLVGMPRQVRTEAQHAIHMIPELDPDDHKIAAPIMGVSTHELQQLLQDAAEHGIEVEPGRIRYAALWHDRIAKRTTIIPPLPTHIRQRIIVRRAIDLSHSSDTLDRQH